jgi:hypothetical protein
MRRVNEEEALNFFCEDSEQQQAVEHWGKQTLASGSIAIDQELLDRLKYLLFRADQHKVEDCEYYSNDWEEHA